MSEFTSDDLIYDWNGVEETPAHTLKLNDETLRDGLQSPSVANPAIEDKIKILHLMEELGCYSADIGIPGAGPQAYNDTLELAAEIARAEMILYPYCAARTIQNDIIPIIEITQKTGLKIQAALFIFSSPIRQFAENWDEDRMLKTSEEAINFAHKNNVPVMYVTEDTTRARPETLRRLYKQAIDLGVERVCISDTVGHATPPGVERIVKFFSELVAESGRDVGIDWHGHRDRGLSIHNAITAYYAGADRIHGCALGIGERVGNTPLDLLMVNFKLLGVFDHDLRKLPEYCRLVSKACEVPIPDNYPVVGSDAFRTQTGVHADAIIKAYKKGDHWLANRVYSGVPADEFGLEQIIEVGPMSGKSNVRYWLEQHDIPVTEDLIDAIFKEAKQVKTVLTDAQIMKVIEQVTSAG
jgi:2-isopropylmalate synthase